MRSHEGLLRHRVQFFDPYPDGALEVDGQPVQHPRLVCEVWAEVTPLDGTERETAERVQSDVTHVVRVRAREDVRASAGRWFLTHRGRKFEVRRVLDLEERRRFLSVECTEQFTK